MDNNEFNENNLGNGQGQDNDLYGFNPDLNHNNYNNNSNYNNDSEGFNQNHNYNSGGLKWKMILKISSEKKMSKW